MRICVVCSWPPRTRNSVDRCLVAGMSYTKVAEKFNRPNRPITRSAITRHSKHVLSPSPEGRRPRGGAPGPAIPGQSLLERVEALIAEHRSIAETAKGTGQLIAAISALREIRSNIEMLGWMMCISGSTRLSRASRASLTLRRPSAMRSLAGVLLAVTSMMALSKSIPGTGSLNTIDVTSRRFMLRPHGHSRAVQVSLYIRISRANGFRARLMSCSAHSCQSVAPTPEGLAENEAEQKGI
jgi:hypothetical protein